ncbi:Putative uncharacterized transposon-derived protein F54H12.3-like Protein [Tribolium castaneum]|uniref:Uncharacterized transposon-derived protein F54H12.3-like Protein n=1 Tax=Tribolium castaneum TaxID=7070 RepID=D7ELJ5_TRICA|nr:Putative uncharacterized transposon-derived protein F54H12.3-like Protein [Tribolium castaneum]
MKRSDLNIKRQVVNELHAPARVNFKRRRVIVKGLNDLLQLDLVEMIPYSRVNKGFKYILMVINVFSKFVWAVPLKNKSALSVVNAMSEILKTRRNVPKNIQTDLGKEFYNKHFQQLMNKYKINHYSSYSNLKSSVVERVNRTIKGMMYKEFSVQGHYNWINILPGIIKKYNNTRHRTTGLKPISINKKNERKVLDQVYSHLKTMDIYKPKFKVGDFVRISKHRHLFKKGYTPNWSNEVFTVSKIQNTNPRTYLLQDVSGETIRGGFYTEELQKVKYPNVYLVEKVLRKKGNRLFVKWSGIDKTHNSWINSSDIT